MAKSKIKAVLSSGQKAREDQLKKNVPYKRTALRVAPSAPDTPEQAAIRARLKARDSANKVTLAEMNKQR